MFKIRPIVPISVLNNTDRPYKVYTFKFTQDSTSNPTVVVHENTIGNIVWTRTGAGAYRGTLTAAFPAVKTYFYCMDVTKPIELFNLGPLEMSLGITTNYVNITLTGGMDLDGKFVDTPFEIRVYP